MCGILGSFAAVPPQELTAAVADGLKLLRHRGPNDSGVWTAQVGERTLALGHTRLSIIDLSSGGHQPMSSRDGRYHVVFNGEIYNYKELREELRCKGHSFQTASDTEVLLACWMDRGKACLRDLRGMFAFVVYDRLQSTLTCVRDAFGIKPFYFSTESGFCFSSEIPPLRLVAKLPFSLNSQRVYDYLVFGRYDAGDKTIHSNVQQLSPGHLMTYDLRKNQHGVPERWWWPQIDERVDLTFKDATAQLRELFLDNVRLHLRSDVPLGCALSGGLDSSAVACAMRYLEPELPIHTFSYVARNSPVDEEHWADLVNLKIGATANKIEATPAELMDDLDDMISVQGEPFGSTSIYAQYRVFKQAKERGVTVMLDGQGADEVLAGYAGYPGPTMLSLLERGQYSRLARFAASWSKWPGRSYKSAASALLGQVVPNSVRTFALKVGGYDISPEWMNDEFVHDVKIDRTMVVTNILDPAARGRRLAEELRRELTGKGLMALLRHADRNSMRWSVESRVPFLTTPLAEFMLSLPENYLVSPGGETKHVFRAAMRGIVPDEILERKDKIGFATPEKSWMAQIAPQLLPWVEAADSIPFIRSDRYRQEMLAIASGQKAFSYQAWRMINFTRWYGHQTGFGQ